MCRQELVLLDNEIVFNEAIIEEREQGIKEIQSQIGQVNEIFKDLGVLVHEQGVVIGKMLQFKWIHWLPFYFISFMCICHIHDFLTPFTIADDIHSNIEASAAVTTQAKQQISKASKSERSGSKWVRYWGFLRKFHEDLVKHY